MKALRNIGLVLTILVVLTTGTALAAVETNENVPLDMVVYVPCANGGSGEYVQLIGDLHVMSLVTFDKNGGLHLVSLYQPMGVTGYGDVTGDKYQATGVTRDNLNIQPAEYPYESTYVNNFRIIGAGPGNNFTVHENVHVTVSASGEVTTEVDNFRVECN